MSATPDPALQLLDVREAVHHDIPASWTGRFAHVSTGGPFEARDWIVRFVVRLDWAGDTKG